MKITVEFDNEGEAIDAINAGLWKKTVWDIDQMLRSVTKYGASINNPSKEASDDQIMICEEIRKEIRKIINENRLSME
jgi:hypothetical protein